MSYMNVFLEMRLQQLKNESIECETSSRELKQPVFELFCSWFGGWLMIESRGIFVVCVVIPSVCCLHIMIITLNDPSDMCTCVLVQFLIFPQLGRQ